MRVLLANPPWRVDGRKGVRAGSRWPHLKIAEEEDYMPYPFFLGYASSLLKENGFDVRLIDAIAEDLYEGHFLRIIKEYDADLILFETSLPSLENDLNLIKEIRRSFTKTLAVAGADMNIYDPVFLREHPDIDLVLVGEYEQTLLDVAKALDEGRGLEGVKGITFRDGEDVRFTGRRDLTDIDSLPWPDRHDVPIYNYHDCPGGIPSPSVQLMASRGCPYHCTFCAWPQVVYGGRNYRTRKVKDIVDEIEYCIRKLHFKSYYFDDDTFNIGKKRMLELADELERRGIDAPWAFMGRSDIVDEEILTRLKRTGLKSVKYGVESGVQSILDKCNKRLDLKVATRNMLLTKRLGLKMHLTFTFGLPGETKETIRRTIGYVLHVDPDSVQFSIATPIPGTAFYDQLDSEGKIVSRDWKQYDGNSHSVIRTDELSSDDLVAAQRLAYRKFLQHKRKVFYARNSPADLFVRCLREHGPIYTLSKSVDYVLGGNLLRYRPGSRRRESKGSRRPGNRMMDAAAIDADVFLIICPVWDIYDPPIGIAYLVEYLRKQDKKVKVLDMNIDLYNHVSEEDKTHWIQNADIWKQEESTLAFMRRYEAFVEHHVRLIAKSKAKVVAFSLNYFNRFFTIEFVRRVKKACPDKTIVFGGIATITQHNRQDWYPKGLVDIFVIGEAEVTFDRLVGRIMEGSSDYSDIPGIIVQHKDGTFSDFRPPVYLTNLDELPYPTYRDFNLKKYHNSSLPIMGCRGCVGKCAFCNDYITMNSYRQRSASHIYNEIKHHVVNYGILTYNFKDLLINGNVQVLEELADRLIQSGMGVNWSSQAIPMKNLLVPGLLPKLRKSGCECLIYGVESGSDPVLKSMRKYFTSDVAQEVIRATKKAGIGVMINIIMGFPGETESEYQETVSFIRRNASYIDSIGCLSTCRLNEGTDIWGKSDEYGITYEESRKARDWSSKDGTNTFAIRLDRAKRLMAVLTECKIKLHTTNIS